MYIPIDKIQVLHCYYWHKDHLQWETDYNYRNDCKFFYLNSIEEYTNLKETYHSTDPFNSVFIPSDVDFPRYKLQMANVKRKIAVENADVIVYDDGDLNYIFDHKGNFENVVIYSKQTDLYYILNTYPNGPDDMMDEFNRILRRLNLQDASPVDKLIALLKYYDKLPNDYEIIYTGPICRIVQPITSKYITTQDLDEHISSNLPTPSENDLASIEQMLKSNDNATISMGLKCLCGYNIYPCKLAIANILFNTWSNLQYNKTINSTGVKNLLNMLNFPKNVYELSTVYKHVIKSGVTEEDYNKAREYITNLITKQYNQRIKGDESSFDMFNIKISVSVE